MAPFFNLLLLAALAFAVRLVYVAVLRRRSIARMSGLANNKDPGNPLMEGLAQWLAKADFRDSAAPSIFLTATGVCVGAGIGLFWFLSSPALLRWVIRNGGDVLAGLGGIMQVGLSLLPAMALLVVSLIPYLYVRQRRRTRETAIEKDLSITLELLATLAEAGFGFDAGISRIKDSAAKNSPLHAEFDIYQRDMLAGIPRVQALRQLAARCGVSTVSTFVATLIQAEVAGASLAETLRRQADDLRDRRKMEALIHSQSLPVKLTVPLLVCFLPGLFVATLGPALHQLIKVVDGAMRPVR